MVNDGRARAIRRGGLIMVSRPMTQRAVGICIVMCNAGAGGLTYPTKKPPDTALLKNPIQGKWKIKAASQHRSHLEYIRSSSG